MNNIGLKILIYGNGETGSNDLLIKKAFINAGCDTVFFDEAKEYSESIRFLKNRYIRAICHRLAYKLFAKNIQTKLIKAIIEQRPDLLFILKGFYLSPKTIKKIRVISGNIKIFCYNPDNPFNNWAHGNSNSWIRKSISLYDTYFIWGKFLIERLYSAGAKKVEYLPFAYDPEYLFPVKINEDEAKYYGADVVFVGSWDKERELWLNNLLDVDLKIWGNQWNKANRLLQKKWQRKAIYGNDFSKVCAASKIILNFIRKQNGDAHNMRTFETPACGGFVLSTRTTEQTEFFPEGLAAEYFSSPEEMRTKIKFYSENNEARQKISEKGHEMVLGHTFDARIGAIIKIYKEAGL